MDLQYICLLFIYIFHSHPFLYCKAYYNNINNNNIIFYYTPVAKHAVSYMNANARMGALLTNTVYTKLEETKSCKCVASSRASTHLPSAA